MTIQPQLRTAVLDGQFSKFDLLLAAIPLTLLSGICFAVALPVPEFVGIAMGAALAASLVGYGIYAVARGKSTGPRQSEPPLGGRTNGI
ncbi:MAG: hypothetical protein ACOC0Z_01575 [Halohasta sp.]